MLSNVSRAWLKNPETSALDSTPRGAAEQQSSHWFARARMAVRQIKGLPPSCCAKPSAEAASPNAPSPTVVRKAPPSATADWCGAASTALRPDEPTLGFRCGEIGNCQRAAVGSDDKPLLLSGEGVRPLCPTDGARATCVLPKRSWFATHRRRQRNIPAALRGLFLSATDFPGLGLRPL